MYVYKKEIVFTASHHSSLITSNLNLLILKMQITPKPIFLFFFVFLLPAATLLLVHADADAEQNTYADCVKICDSDYPFYLRSACYVGCSITNSHIQKVKEEEGDQESKGEKNPYLFQDQHFQTKAETEQGRVRLLQNFAQSSKLLLGLVNHRVEILEANPSTFIAPSHSDAEALFFIAQGKATLNLLRQDNKRQTLNLKLGDFIRIPSGTTLYLINTDRKEKLVLIKLYQPVSTPGHFQTFFGPGGKDPESFFNVFTPELLQYAFNAKRETIQRVFQKQSQGVIVKVTEQQIRAMTSQQQQQQQQEETAAKRWPFRGGGGGGGGGELLDAFNLFERRALSESKSNKYGKLYEISANDNKDLTKLNVGVTYANITKGSMTAPLYNSKATKIVFVIRGEGYFEMACPHLSSRSTESGQQRGYERVSGKLKKGVIYVVPAGHPIITVSDGSQNLELLSLEVNGLDNEKVLLAGRKNIISEIEKTALELSFGGIQEKEVREVFESQTEVFFFKGPDHYSQHQQQQQQKEE